MGDLNHRSWNDVVCKTKGRKNRKRTARGHSSAIGFDLEPAFDFEGIELESKEEDVNYEVDAGSAKLDQILAANSP